MVKFILFIGLLITASQSWSKSMVMECYVDIDPFFKELTMGDTKLSVGIYKMEIEKTSDSPDLLSTREKGLWRPLCKKGCEKRDLSVHFKNDDGELTVDFKFKTLELIKTTNQSEETFTAKCELIPIPSDT